MSSTDLTTNPGLTFAVEQNLKDYRIRYPVWRAAASFVEKWMLIALPAVLTLATAARVFLQFDRIWILATVGVFMFAAVAARARRNKRLLRSRAAAYIEKRQRGRRLGALTRSARVAVEGLRTEKRNIYERSSMAGQGLADVLARLEGYETDFIDLLYQFQVRGERLKEIRERGLDEERGELERERAKLEGSGAKETLLGQRTRAALDQQETLLRRQEETAREMEASMTLIKTQAGNIRRMFALVHDQVTTMPVGVDWSGNLRDFEQLSDTIQMTKQALEGTIEAR